MTATAPDDAELDQALRSAVADLGPRLDGYAQELALHFCDHREYGLALEQIVTCLAEDDAPVPEPVAASLGHLAERMGLQARVRGPADRAPS